MVFESLVTDLLNKYLGTFVENLDRSQLKIGIWGGDVVLKNLKLKDSALDDLNLPIRTVYGHLGKLVLKIPWKNLYTSPVEAHIEQLFLLAVPNLNIKYDAEKEEKWTQNAKQAELKKYEEKKRAIFGAKDKAKSSDTFTEKLATQIIKNLQVSVKNIHIRYEDNFNRPEKPFAIGITLSSLVLRSIDSWGDPTGINPANLIFKELILEALTVYWNCSTDAFYDKNSHGQSDYYSPFESGIASKQNKPKKYDYLLGPINSSANLRINTKPEIDGTNYAVPKLLLQFEIETLLLSVSRDQFQDILVIGEAAGRMSTQNLYRRFRPSVNSYRGYYRLWWNFAYNCILETEIRRRRNNWRWSRMKHHRALCKGYAEAYKVKANSSKPSSDMNDKCLEFEKKLDVLNIILIRERIDLEVARKIVYQESVKDQGWFGKWWGSGTEVAKTDENEDDIATKFQNAMTTTEKEKLFKAIDYDEDAANPADYPPHFVLVDIYFQLYRFQVDVTDRQLTDPRVLSVSFARVATRLRQRPTRSNVLIETSVDLMTAMGCTQDGIVPHLIEPRPILANREGDADTSAQPPLFKCLIEIKPLDSSCDQRVHIQAMPLQIVYDSVTINSIVRVFTVEGKQTMQPIQAAASMKLAQLKQKSALGLQYVIENHSIFDLHVDMMASLIILPKFGFYKRKEMDVIVLNLGRFEFNSTPRRESGVNVKDLYNRGLSEDQVLAEMISHSYDNFQLKISDLQIVFAKENESWDQPDISDNLYILKPTSLMVYLGRCLVCDDPRLPKIKLNAELPGIQVNIIDTRVLDIITLLISIPFPESEDEEIVVETTMKGAAALGSTASLTSSVILRPHTPTKKIEAGKPDEEIVQFIDLDFNFELKQLSIRVMKDDPNEESPPLLLQFQLMSLEASLVKRTFDLGTVLRLGGISLEQGYQENIIKIINTPMASGLNDYLFTVSYKNVSRNSPEFLTKYASVVQSISIEFTKLDALFHQEAILYLVNFALNIQSRITNIMADKKSVVVAREKRVSVGNTTQANPTYNKVLSMITEEGGPISQKTKVKSKKSSNKVEVVDLKLDVNMRSISIELANNAGSLAFLGVNGGVAMVTLQKSSTVIEASLMGVSLKDRTCDLYSQILSVVDEKEALLVRVVLYNEEERAARKIDLTFSASLACVRFVFLNRFLTSVMNFLNNFQTAQSVLFDATQAAAEKAKANVQGAFQNAVRMILDIKIKAPIIIVPVNSVCPLAYLLDMGYLSITNSIAEVKTSVSDELASLDNIKITLDNFKLSQVSLDNKLEVTQERLFLKPITFTLKIQRNLSSGWYTSIPDMEIGGKLHTIHMMIFRDDYEILMRIMKENLGDKGDSKMAAKQKTPTKKPQVNIKHDSSNPTISKKELYSANYEKSQATIKFYFTLESLVFEMFTGNPKIEKSIDKLAVFKLLIISSKGSMLNDGSLFVSLLLIDCIMEDSRNSQKDSINRYMERKGSQYDGEVPKTMVDITVQTKKEAMFLDLRVSSFNLILNIEHLMKIMLLFETHKVEEKENVLELQKIRTEKPRTLQPTGSGAALDATNKSCLTINLKLEHPDIILIESLNDINTNALILQAEIIFKLRILDDSKMVSGTIQDLQLASCCYNPDKRDVTKAAVLRPFTITVNGSTPLKSGFHVDMFTTAINISVSADVMQLLNNVYGAITAENKDPLKKTVQIADHSKLWDVSTFEEDDFLFLTTEIGEEAATYVPPELEESSASSASAEEVISEICIFAIPSIVVTVEMGSSLTKIPMLHFEASVQASMKNWSSQLNIDSQLTAWLSYYNSNLAVWEPLLEPVETIKNKVSEFVPWELNVQIEKNELEEVKSQSGMSVKIKPEMSVFVSSKEMMYITITKTCLEVFRSLSTSFTDAMFKPAEKAIEEMAQFVLINETGLSITVQLNNSDFKLFHRRTSEASASDDINEVTLESMAKVELSPSYNAPSLVSNMSTNFSKEERYIRVMVNRFNCTLDVPVLKSDKRFFLLNHRSHGNDPWGIVSYVQFNQGSTCITLSSIIQVANYLSVPVNVYYMTEKGNEVKSIGSIPPLQFMNLPVHSVYTPTNEIFFSINGYTLSVKPFIWKDLQRSLKKTMLMQCNSKSIEDLEPFFIQAIGETEQIYYELTNRHTMASVRYIIQLRPSVILKNLLPMDIVCILQGAPTERNIEAGKQIQLNTAEPGSSSLIIRIPDYLDREWSSKNELLAKPAEFSVWTFSSYVNHKFTLDLGVHTISRHGSLLIVIYAPFWMINNTGLLLSYRQADDMSNVVYHPSDYNKPILFSFHSKVFFAKKKSCLRVEDGSWSDKFSLDVVGSSGVLQCKASNKTFQVGVNIKLTSSSLTKQVMFTPFFVIINNCALTIELKEHTPAQSPSTAHKRSHQWFSLAPENCKPFWPSSGHGYLVLRFEGTEETTIPFMFHRMHNSVLKLKNKFGAINVDVQISEGRVLISLFPYEDGMAPALILNHTHHDITLCDKATKDKPFTLKPMEKLLFTWGKSEDLHYLSWKHMKEGHNLREDAIGEFLFDKSEEMAFWVLFLYGLQRILLFTSDPIIAQQAQSLSDFDLANMEVDISIHGIGISLVDNLSRVEVLYLGVTSSGIIWESRNLNKTRKRFKPLSHHDSSRIETAYQKYVTAISTGDYPSPLVDVDHRIQVNFESLEMLKPARKSIHRRYNTGLWLHFVTSPHQLQFHAKINRIQIDNQMFYCVFPVVLCPVPPPKTIAISNAHKPFMEFSVVKRLNNYSAVQQYKYFKVLVQEFHIKVDIGFINALVKLFEGNEMSDKDALIQFRKELEAAGEPLIQHIAFVSSMDQKNFYDILHLSPLKIHLSFSLSGRANVTNEDSVIPDFLNIFAQSFGVTLTDVQDVIFKLAYFERQYQFMTQKQLVTEVQNHYVSQFLRQLYVLVLGLDVIGNPFGLFMGFTQGATDLFYEPFQGAIQGPGEFAEGLVLGVRSLFGHTVGGAAGAFSKITGAMGKGLAALSFDKEYQKQRREALTNRPLNVQEGLAQSGKDLVMGVVEGVGGVIVKPITGAKEEGIQGFFKGVGKGVMGLVTRPAGGVIDFASGSFNAVRRVTDTTEEVTRLRCPRYLPADGIVKPYSKLQAEGHKLLVDLDKGKYLATDVYEFHMAIGQGKNRDMLLLTDQRIVYLTHNELFGGFQVDWSHTWDELTGPPKIVAQGVCISAVDRKRGVPKIFSTSSMGKVLLIYDDNTRRLLVDKVKHLMERGISSKPTSSVSVVNN